jgi:UDP-glucuronate decarboxylase
MSATRAVVTGGLGFIGSHLVDSLREDGHEVVILDNGVTGQHRPELDAPTDQLKMIDHNVQNPFPSIEDVDVIYHFASRASPASFDNHPVSIALTNSIGTKHALDFAVKHDATMVLASSSGVYGDPEVSPQPETYTGNVDLHNTRAPYDESKRFAEVLAEAYLRKYDLDVRIIRPFNVYGPRMRPDDGRVIPNFLMQALSGEPLTVYGDGTQTRCFCYVSDLIGGIRKLDALPTDEGCGLVVNLGSEDVISIRELAERVLSVVDTSSEISYEQQPDGDPTSRRPDLQRTKSVLNWEASTNLNTGLRRTAEWYRKYAPVQSTTDD